MKKKTPWVLIIIFGLVVAFGGYLLSGAAAPGRDIISWWKIFSEDIVKNPFGSNYWNKYSIIFVIGSITVYFLVIAFYEEQKKVYMIGKEFGTSRWAQPAEINKKIVDQHNSHTDEKNIIVPKKGGLNRYSQVVNTRNQYISQNIQMSIDTRHHGLNCNRLLMGGSGKGKSYKFVKPNIMQLFGSYILTDPKGELIRSAAGFLEKHGYRVVAINLNRKRGMRRSSHYNPFRYIRSDEDVLTLVSNFISNTTKKGTSTADPFWEKAEAQYIQSLIYGVREVFPQSKQNFVEVIKLHNMAKMEVDAYGNRLPNELDAFFNSIEEKNPDSLAVINYRQSMGGAADTVRSILACANARFAPMQSKEVLDILSDDDIDIASIGKKKTAVFCVVPDSDKTFNFIVGMFYTQLFQELYYQADEIFEGELPIHVKCILDEFANVALPDDYCTVHSTIRSRNISADIIIQNISQIKNLFKENLWETIPGNCDTLIYLGGNEQSSFKYISELMDKMTIDKRTTGESKGRNGSSSKNFDVLGRELMTPGEIRKLKNSECIVLVAGFDPVKDKKINPRTHPLWKEMVSTEKVFEPEHRNTRKMKSGKIEMISSSELEQEQRQYDIDKEDMLYESDGKNEPDKRIFRMSYEALSSISEKDLEEPFEIGQLFDEETIKCNQNKEKEKIEREEKEEIELKKYSQKETEFILIMQKGNYQNSQIKILIPLLQNYNKEDIIGMFSEDMDEEKMQACVNNLLA